MENPAVNSGTSLVSLPLLSKLRDPRRIQNPMAFDYYLQPAALSESLRGRLDSVLAGSTRAS